MRSQHQLFTKRMHCVASKFCLQVRNIPLMTVCDIDEQRIFLCERIFCARWRLESQTFNAFPRRPENFQLTNVSYRRHRIPVPEIVETLVFSKWDAWSTQKKKCFWFHSNRPVSVTRNEILLKIWKLSSKLFGNTMDRGKEQIWGVNL